MLETVDFSEFEAMFQVKRFEKGKKQLKREESESHIPTHTLHCYVYAKMCALVSSFNIFFPTYRSTEIVAAASFDREQKSTQPWYVSFLCFQSL